MPDPVTIGALVASALGMAGEAFLKGAAGESAKDAYKVLKAKIATWAYDDVQALEKTPTSPARQSVVAEVIDDQSPEDQANVRALADQLTTALQAISPVGIDIGRLDALSVKLGAISVMTGTGVRIAEAHMPGTFETGDITVGKDSEKK